MPQEKPDAAVERDSAHRDWRKRFPWLHAFQRISHAAASTPGLGRRWPAISRPLRQYWARRVRSELPAELPGGITIPVRLHEHVEAGVFWYGFPQEDRGALRTLQQRLPADGTLIDVGANIGCFSLPLAKQLTAGRVHAFEPIPTVRTRLQRAIDTHGLDNVSVNDCALSSEHGEIVLHVPDAQWKGALYNSGRTSRYVGDGEDGWSAQPTRCVTLDSYAEQHRLTRIDAIKIDVEGAELDVLQGARNTLRAHRPAVLMELNQPTLAAAGHSIADVVGFWTENGYRMHRVGSDGDLHQVDTQRALRGHCNVLCLPT